MINKSFSLIYPNYDNSTANTVDISNETIEAIELDYLINLKNGSLSEYFSADVDTIRFRQETIKDMLDIPELSTLLLDIMPMLSDISELRRVQGELGAKENYLYCITEIELYIECIEKLKHDFLPLSKKVKSTAFIKMAEAVAKLAESDYYKQLNKRLDELTFKVHEVKSVAIGVNLDNELRPTDAGVISLNPEKFKSGTVIDKILRLDFKDDDYTCIAPLVPFTKGQNENQFFALSNALNNALSDIFKSSVRSWRTIVRSYVLENTDFLLKIIPEIEFLVKSTKLLRALKDRGLALTFPEICKLSDKKCELYGLYNPCVALKTDAQMVKNDLVFDENGMIYILTGPNRGGKSVITCALGLVQAMAQLGLPVTADKAKLSPVESIYTHFPTEAEDTIDKGRLGEECERLNAIFDKVSEYSLVLLDESLSSTGSYEASYIASEVLTGFSLAKCRCLFSTHLHELSARVDEINETAKAEGGVLVDTLVAGIKGNERSFEIVRTKPDGKSYARDIAERYGLSSEKIRNKISDK
ncbi:MAG: hypothetical protein E7635_03220 [Ruminococcaceae bacterium]|nr:hypothetical protein [Oscillospiraceae bacterium]